MDPLNDVCTYKGYILPPFTTAPFMEEFENFECREDDIVIATYPKSGTHWMQEIVQLILADGHLEQLTSDKRINAMELSRSPIFTKEALVEAGPNLRHLQKAPSPRVLTTHVQRDLLPRQIAEKGCKVIYVVRHPKDVVISFYNFIRKIYGRSGIHCEDTPEFFERFFQKMIDGKYYYGDWWEHVLEYSKESSNEKYFFTTFEDMKSNTKQVVSDVAAFIGRELSEESIERVVRGSSLESMRQSYQQGQNGKKKDADVFFNKGKVGQWTVRFTPEQNEQFNQRFRSKIDGCELTKSYSME